MCINEGEDVRLKEIGGKIEKRVENLQQTQKKKRNTKAVDSIKIKVNSKGKVGFKMIDILTSIIIFSKNLKGTAYIQLCLKYNLTSLLGLLISSCTLIHHIYET